jgi:hypothetical protein
MVRVHECGLAQVGDTAAEGAFTSFFASTRRGWTGGDGTFSLRLPDGRTVWLFGDSFVGGLEADGVTRHPKRWHWVRNAIAVQERDCLSTVLHRDGRAFLPSDQDRTVLWPSQAVVDGPVVRAFFSRVREGEHPMDLTVVGTVLVTLDLATLRPIATKEIATGPLFWGAAVVKRGATTYVYGVDSKEHRLHVARTTGPLDGPWEFWTGTTWRDKIAESGPVHDSPVVPNQLSVIERDGKLVLAAQPAFTSRLDGWTATAPEGPWTARSAPLATWETPAGAVTYNALLHPHAGRSLVSYNVNGDAAFTDGRVYRPRFTRVVEWGP